jgi:TRAP transporter 4TM/12TM fusion protein
MNQMKGPKAEGILNWAIVIVGCAMALYQLLITQYRFQGALEDYNLHLGFALALVFLASLGKLKKSRWWPFVLILLFASLTVTTYIKVNYTHLERVVGLPDTIDVIMGIVLIVVVMEATRLAWGPILPTITFLFILYFVFGQHMPWAMLAHGGFSWSYIVSVLGIGFKGIFGDFLAVSANFIFLFLVFGGLMEVIGVPGLLLEVGKLAGRVLAGGPGHTAVVGSSIIGTVTGAAVANVSLTGTFTIPLMKKVGYHPDTAGSIEATASTGGQLMPPIMGAAAFLIAYNLGLPYVKVMIAGIVPALFYYFTVFMGVQVIALKQKIAAPTEEVDKELILRRAPVFLIPMTIIVILLLLRYSPMYAAFYAIITAMVLSFIQKQTRPKLINVARGMANGAIAGSKIAIVLACVGIIAQTLYSTGAGVKLTGLVEELTAGHLFPALILTMIISIILGCGVPTAGAYILVALTVARALTRMGVSEISAHFFSFYFAIISALTPPVALAALAGASIAGGDYWKTSVSAFKLAIAGFILPFCMVYNPVFLLQGGGVAAGVSSLLAGVLGTASLVAAIYNYFMAPVTVWERWAHVLCATTFLVYIVSQNYLSLVVGVAVFTWLMVMQWKTRMRVSVDSYIDGIGTCGTYGNANEQIEKM